MPNLLSAASGLRIVCMLPLLLWADRPGTYRQAALTPPPHGPYHIEGNRILDALNRQYLLRGTQLAPLSADEPSQESSETTFGPWSATTLVTIRQRLNMNAVRIPLSIADYNVSPEYRGRVGRLIGLANLLELLVILEASTPLRGTGSGAIDQFWADVATRFGRKPNLFFAPLAPHLARIIRQSGAVQPVIVTGPPPVTPEDSNTIYEVNPRYTSLKTDADRMKQFGPETADVPILVNGLDPGFNESSGDCNSFPTDPAEATALLEANLALFDKLKISWTLSAFTPGRLITDYRYFNGTKLDDGWTCAAPNEPAAGIGMILLSHLWGATPLGLFAVSESRGGVVIARGAISTAYGPILAGKEMSAHGPVLPTRLGNVSVRVTDSRGVARPAPLLYTGAGWSFISFLLPEACAVGPAEVAVVRADGSFSKAGILIANLAPAILTSPPDGRSIAVGEVTQHAAGKPDKSSPTAICGLRGCRAIPISLSREVSTTLRIVGTGFHHVGEHSSIRVVAGNRVLPVLTVGRNTEPGTDQITVQIPDTLKGAGETDLYIKVNSEISNVARLNFGETR